MGAGKDVENKQWALYKSSERYRVQR